MPRKRSEQPSAPTIRTWLWKYYTWLPGLIESGGLYPEEGKRVAKGLKYALKALDDSAARYRQDKRDGLKADVEKADEYFRED